MDKKKCVLVGAGGRGSRSYVEPIAQGHLSDICAMCGIYDTVRARAEIVSRENGSIPIFDDFDTMLSTVDPDFVIVTTKDSDHHEYIIKALEAGYDVITEKPMTNTRKKALAILDAEKKSGKTVRVTFNMRYMKPIVDLKKIVMDGVLGKITHVDFEWLLDRSHGADYFRRWHRYKDNTNSLLLHKATHHFDVINWVIGNKVPDSVFARCYLDFYGKNGEFRGEACHSCPHKDKCDYYFDITKSEFDKKLYYDIREESGYNRDSCIFAEDIDIFDRMALNVRYTDGTTMNYSLVAYSPDEGCRIRIHGDHGRLDFEYHSSGPDASNNITITVYDLKGNKTVTNTHFESGAHGGADDKMREDIFRGRTEPDVLGQFANSYAGFTSLAIGDMAVLSSELGREVHIDELE